MSFCGLKQAQQLFMSCGGKSKSQNKITKKFEHINTTQFDGNLHSLNKSEFDKIDEHTVLTSNSLLNMSKNITLLSLSSDSNSSDDSAVNMYKQLNQCSMTKPANIPMMVVKTFRPTQNHVQSQHKISNGIKIFSNTKSKQIEIHRGMTINALFCRDEWLYIKTAQNECGYVPLDTCKPVGRKRSIGSEIYDKTTINNKTCVSLLDVTCDQQQMVVSDESDDATNDIRSYKIQHYLNTLQQTLDVDACEIDSGYSDTESQVTILANKQISQSCEILFNKRRCGIKTNGSICATNNTQSQQIDNDMRQISKSEMDLSSIKKCMSNKLSTIIEQSYHTTNDISHECKRNCVSSNILDSTELDFVMSNQSNLQLCTSSNSDLSSSNLKLILEDYTPQFVDDLQVYKNEMVTLLDDANQDWIYVISQNGKGYVPRTCIKN